MKALDRKLLRDLWLIWSQALTIALVVASGVGGFLTTLSAVDSLALARDRFYAQGRFADVFAGVKRAPLALAETLREVAGVADVQTTAEFDVRIEIAGEADPIVGHLIGIDRRSPPRMNRLTLRSGHADDASMSPGPALADGNLPAGGRARLQPVQIGARNGNLAWVSKGLDVGTKVIVDPPATVKDGAKVVVRGV
jgi:putative ABC transport system permease protein